MAEMVREIGVDEAGYAPRLGPLVASAAWLDRPAGSGDLYEALAPCVLASRKAGSGSRGGRGDPVVIADSKAVYSPEVGLAPLERGVLSFARLAVGERARSDLEMVSALAGGRIDIDGLAWYEGDGCALPVEADNDDIAAAAEGLATALSSARIGGLGIRSRVVTARELNRSLDEHTNKADVLAGIVSQLLASATPERGRAAVTVDRLGGRKYYEGLLARTWPLATVTGLVERDAESSYELSRAAARGRLRCSVRFACRAEDSSMLVALASMVSKYVRELFMRRLNRWFADRMPGLAPTAGYPQDATRFLADTRRLRRTTGIDDRQLIRSR